jgi:hypothetical protein
MKLNGFFNDKMTRQAPDALSPAPGQAEPAPAADAVDLSFIPADYLVDGKPDTAKFTTHYQELLAADAQRKEAMAGVPEDGKYAFALPDDLKFDGLELPEGFAVNLMTDDPVMAPLYDEMGALLKELGAPKEAAGKAATLIAKYEATKASIQKKADDAAFETWATGMKTLGNDAQVKARVAGVERKLETMLPAEQVKALFSGERISADGIKALEKILGTKSLGAPPPQPPTVKDDLDAYYSTPKR